MKHLWMLLLSAAFLPTWTFSVSEQNIQSDQGTLTMLGQVIQGYNNQHFSEKGHFIECLTPSCRQLSSPYRPSSSVTIINNNVVQNVYRGASSTAPSRSSDGINSLGNTEIQDISVNPNSNAGVVGNNFFSGNGSTLNDINPSNISQRSAELLTPPSSLFGGDSSLLDDSTTSNTPALFNPSYLEIAENTEGTEQALDQPYTIVSRENPDILKPKGLVDTGKLNYQAPQDSFLAENLIQTAQLSPSIGGGSLGSGIGANKKRSRTDDYAPQQLAAYRPQGGSIGAQQTEPNSRPRTAVSTPAGPTEQARTDTKDKKPVGFGTTDEDYISETELGKKIQVAAKNEGSFHPSESTVNNEDSPTTETLAASELLGELFEGLDDFNHVIFHRCLKASIQSLPEAEIEKHLLEMEDLRITENINLANKSTDLNCLDKDGRQIAFQDFKHEYSNEVAFLESKLQQEPDNAKLIKQFKLLQLAFTHYKATRGSFLEETQKLNETDENLLPQRPIHTGIGLSI